MPLELVVVLILVLPVVLFFSVLFWLLTFGRGYAAVREARPSRHALGGKNKPPA